MRRRNKNPLLMRIILLSVLIHVLALPILAHFGAFKKIQERYFETRLVTLPPPPREQVKREKKTTRKEVKKQTQTARKARSAPQNRRVARQSPVNIPKVVASGAGPGGGAEPAVAANGTGKVGELPTPATSTPSAAATNPAAQPATGPKVTEPPAKPAPAAAPVTNPAATSEAPAKPVTAPAPRVPVFTEVAAIFSPQPTIPDNLREDAFDKTFIAEFTVGTDGRPTSIKVAQSTGIDELDRIAMDTAKQWRFKPALRDGQPVESTVRLHITFQVS